MPIEPAEPDLVRPLASIIIPAHNEARVLGDCLDMLVRDVESGEFDIVVVCNGCTDDTAGVARQYDGQVRVFSIAHASKVAALNLGDSVARAYPRVYLDSDLQVSGKAIRSLVLALAKDKLAAIGFMNITLQNRSWLIRNFYRVWLLHPYLMQGKFGGVYALSEAGCRKRGPYPNVIADDAFVMSQFAPKDCVAVPECRFTVYPPATMMNLLRIRTRSHLGNFQLKDSINPARGVKASDQREWLKRIAKNPKTWPGLVIYVAVNATAKINALYRHRFAVYTWLRDESSRQRVFPRASV
jgi:glycosyltransferase involved in cell wall biosynthesis